MAARAGYPGTPVTGDVLTVTNFNKLPAGCLGYLSKTTDQTAVTTTEVDLGGLDTLDVVHIASRLVRVSFTVRVETTQGSTAQAQANVRCYGGLTGATVLTTATRDAHTANAGTVQTTTLNASMLITPAAGTHQYGLSAFTVGTGTTMIVRASATQPSVLVVEDLGPLF
jgi:hypothetical protein